MRQSANRWDIGHLGTVFEKCNRCGIANLLCCSEWTENRESGFLHFPSRHELAAISSRHDDAIACVTYASHQPRWQEMNGQEKWTISCHPAGDGIGRPNT